MTAKIIPIRPIYKVKDTEAYCHECGVLYFTLARDVYTGDVMRPSDVYEDKGQAPFKSGEPAVCKVCDTEMNPTKLIYREPMHAH